MLDPELNEACSVDVQNFCQSVKHGKAQVHC